MEKCINQTLITSLVVIFRSFLNKEGNFTPKSVVSVWFIHFSTFLSSCQIYQNLYTAFILLLGL